MTRLLAALMVFLWTGLVVCHASDGLPIQVYVCPRAASAPTIDGRLNDACWQAAPVANAFAEFHGGAPAPVQTRFQAVFDDAALYIGVTCDEPTPARVSRVQAARDELEIFRQEAVEVFLDPGHTHGTFYQLGVNAAGSLYDAGPETGTRWEGGIEAAALIGEKAWHVELRIPWQSLQVTPALGQVHGVNVCRDRYIGASQPWSSWARVMRTFHDPVRFGHLVLAPTAAQLGDLRTQLRHSERTGPIRITAADAFGDVACRALLRAALAALQTSLGELRRIADAEPDEAVRRGIEGRIAEYAAAADEARDALAEGSADAEALARLEARLSDTTAGFDKLLWEVRLQALLAGI